MEQKRKTIEWHPAFTASLQIEFEDEADKIIFESEHLLSKKPMQIDELVIKVHDNEKIQKNIGRIFRKHNIVEYKSPEDIWFHPFRILRFHIHKLDQLH